MCTIGSDRSAITDRQVAFGASQPWLLALPLALIRKQCDLWLGTSSNGTFYPAGGITSLLP